MFNQAGKLAYALAVGGTSKLPVTCVRFKPDGKGSLLAAGEWLTRSSRVLAWRARHVRSGVAVPGADGTISNWYMTSQKHSYVIEEKDNQVYAVSSSIGIAIVPRSLLRSVGRSTRRRDVCHGWT